MRYLILVLLLSINCHADSIYTGLWSHHYNWSETCFDKCEREANEKNDLVMVEYKGYEVGTFVNSYFDRSYIAMKYVQMIDITDDLRLDGHLGLVKGYDRGTTFMCFLTLAYTKYRIEPVFMVSPEVSAVTFRIKF